MSWWTPSAGGPDDAECPWVARLSARTLPVLACAGASPSSGEGARACRTMFDDQRGVAEPLNETMCGCRLCDCEGLIVRGSHYGIFTVRSSLGRPVQPSSALCGEPRSPLHLRMG